MSSETGIHTSDTIIAGIKDQKLCLMVHQPPPVTKTSPMFKVLPVSHAIFSKHSRTDSVATSDNLDSLKESERSD